MAGFEILPVRDRRTRRAFLDAPGRVMAGDPAFVAPLRMEEAKRLSAKRHPFYQDGRAAFWVARNSAGRPVGRVSAQVSRRHQARHGAREGHFGCLAAADDPALTAALLAEAEAWLRREGCNAAIGPASLSINEEIGLLVSGFATPPMLLMGHDPSWLGGQVEAAGYVKARDLIAYAYDPRSGPPERLKAFAAKFAHIPGARIRTFDRRRFGADLRAILAIFNDAWADNWGAVPMSDADLRDMAQAFRLLADYGLIFIAEIDGKPVGMAASLPNLNEALAGLRGAASPAALARFLWRLKVKGVASARVLLMGVMRSAQADLAVGPVVGMALVDALVEAHRAKGYRLMELSWVLEDNRPMRRIAEMGGARPYKTYRVYRKALA